MEWFEQYAWQVWTALALVLGVLELFSMELFLLMLAAGAGVAALGTSVAMLALVRPNIVKRLHSGPELRLGHHALVGREAVAVSRIDGDAGQVRINGELWTARAYDPTCVIPEGARVDVMQIKGATALVHEIPSLESGDA
jgi:membrane protein implicated in regulation of membrane protease activity